MSNIPVKPGQLVRSSSARFAIKPVLRAFTAALLIFCSNALGNGLGIDKLPANILVLDFELNDLTLHPNIKHEEERVKTLRPLLTQKLADDFTYSIAELSQSHRDSENKGKGYIFDRPEVAARMARAAGADWVVSGRLHKASFLFVYLKAQLIDAADGRIAADFVVEIKGWEPRLTAKGVDTLALQIDESLRTLNKAE